MPITTTLPWDSIARTRSFAGLMSLWESNYHRLQQLLPKLDLNVDEARSLAQADSPLYLQIIERSPYTLTLLLTYRLAGYGEVPKLRVRIYKDAGLAQAMDAQPSKLGEHLDRQFERNLLLNKWLDYCLARGHGFALAEQQQD